MKAGSGLTPQSTLLTIYLIGISAIHYCNFQNRTHCLCRLAKSGPMSYGIGSYQNQTVAQEFFFKVVMNLYKKTYSFFRSFADSNYKALIYYKRRFL